MDVLCIGEALIDFVSRERGQTLVTATQYTAATGGAPANVAAGLAKLGRKARLVATVGNDIYGRKILHDLQQLGVDCELHIDPDHFTTLAFVRQAPEGHREFEFNIGAHDHLQPDQIHEDTVRSARVLHYGSISLRSSISRDATLKAIRIAKDNGILTSCDPNWRAALWPNVEQGRNAMREAIKHADILKISKGDLSVILETEHNQTDYAAALDEIGFTGRLATVTLGRDGSWYKAGDITGAIPSPHVHVVETTGSGDAFTAALLDSLLGYDLAIEDLDAPTLRGLIERACAAGALTATGYGAIPSLPTDTEIRALQRMVHAAK